MFFTRLRICFAKLDNNLKAQFIYKDREYYFHQLVWQFFTQETKRNFLYRVRQTLPQLTQSHSDFEIYVLSKNAPLPLNLSGVSLDTKAFNPHFVQNQILSFDLRVAPKVHDRSQGLDNSKRRGKTYGLFLKCKKQNPDLDSRSLQALCAVELDKWLQRQGERGGFKFVDYYLDDQTSHAISKNSSRELNAALLKFNSLDLKGVLQIKDPLKFSEQLLFGFGAQKSFGCGLMLLSKL